MAPQEKLWTLADSIVRDAPGWGIDLTDQANEFTLWTLTSDRRRMLYCGSRTDIQEISWLAYQHTGLKELYVAMVQNEWIGVQQYQRP